MSFPSWGPLVIGSAAAICTTGAFVPQLHRVWASGSSRDISVLAFLVLAVGTFAWAVYGVLIGSIPVVLANVVTFALVASTLGIALRHRSPAAVPPSTPPRREA